MAAGVIAGVFFALAGGWAVCALVFRRMQDVPLGPAGGTGDRYRRSAERNLSAQEGRDRSDYARNCRHDSD